MTISTTDMRFVYNGNGVTTVFSFPRKYYNTTHIVVTVDGVVQTEGVDYTVDADGSVSGGDITFLAGSIPPSGTRNVVLERILPITQPDDPQNFDGNPADSTERVYDEMVMRQQQIQDQLDRAVKLPNTTSTTDITIPEPEDGKALVWSGTDLANSVDDFNDIVADASAAQTAAEAAQTAAEAAQTAAESAEANASSSETAAAASAAAAAAAAAEGLYQSITNKAFADSPFVPPVTEEGNLYRVDTSGGSVVINLSDLATYNEDMKFAFVKVTGDANTVTINVDAGDDLNGVTGGSYVIDTAEAVVDVVGQLSSGAWHTIIGSTSIGDNSLTLAKLQQVGSYKALANLTGSTANVAETDVLTSTTLAGAANTNMATALALKTYIDDQVASASPEGSVIQTQYDQNTGGTQGTGTIPYDDTAPVSTDGDEIFSVAITPTATSSKIKIDVSIPVVAMTASGTQTTVAVFRDGTYVGNLGNAFASDGNDNGQGNICGFIFDEPNTTSAVTYTGRIGADNGTWFINRTRTGASLFNGEPKYVMAATEIKGS